MPPVKYARAIFAVHYYFGDEFVYIVGGSDQINKGIKECEKYEISTQKWSSFGHLQNSRKGAALIEVDNSLYIFGGRNDDGSIVKQVEKKSLSSDGEFNFVNI